MTCPRHFEARAAAEAARVLEGIGGGPARARASGISGIVTAESGADPVEAARAVRRLALDEPWEVRYIQRAIPVHAWVGTGLDAIVAGALRLAPRIPEGASYRVTVEKRNSSVPSRGIIEGIAAGVDRPVSLERPGRVVLVEVLGGTTGLAVVEPGDVVSVSRARRGASE